MQPIDLFVPTIGRNFLFYIYNIKFSFGNNFITFYYSSSNNTFTTTLKRQYDCHNKLVIHLKDVLNTSSKKERQFALGKHASKNIYYLRFSNLNYMYKLLSNLFQSRVVLDFYFENTDRYNIGCDFHLVDLYEMGYLSRTDVLYKPIMKSSKSTIFTGLKIYAFKPYGVPMYQYDYVHLCYSHNTFLFSVVLDSLIQNKPYLHSKLTSIIVKIVNEIPLTEKAIQRNELGFWDQYQQLEISQKDLYCNIDEWRPYFFLKHFTKLLDIFPSYNIVPDFVISSTIPDD